MTEIPNEGIGLPRHSLQVPMPNVRPPVDKEKLAAATKRYEDSLAEVLRFQMESIKLGLAVVQTDGPFLSEYPADVRFLAHKVISAHSRQYMSEIVCDAIIAERQRCAAVADWFSDTSMNSNWTEDACSAGYYACREVAEEIRNPKPAPPPSQFIADGDVPF